MSIRGIVLSSDISQLLFYTRLLSRTNVEMLQAPNADVALALVKHAAPDFLILDGDNAGTDHSVLQQLLLSIRAEKTAILLLAGSDDSPALKYLRQYALSFATLPTKQDAEAALQTICEHVPEGALFTRLRDEMHRFRALVMTQVDALLVLNLTGTILFANRAATELFGRESAQLEGASFGYPLHGEDPFEVHIVHPAFKNLIAEVYLTDLAWNDAPAKLATLRDVTENRRATQRLQEQAALLGYAQTLGRMGSWHMDLLAGKLHWSEITSELFGFEPGKFPQDFETFRSMIHEEDVSSFDEKHNLLREGCPSIEIEYRIRRRNDAAVRCMLERGAVIYDSEGSAIARIGMVSDVTEQRNAKRETQQLSARLLETMENIADGFVTVDAELKVTFANATAVAVLNTAKEHLTGHSLREFLDSTGQADFFRYCEQAMSTKNAVQYEDAKLVPGIVLDIRIDPAFTGLAISLRDKTMQKAFEEQLEQAQRLESLGQLTGGVAHDFNNLLTVILGNAELLSINDDITEQQMKLVDMVSSAAQRGSRLTQQLLAFARKQVLAPNVTDINTLIDGMFDLLRHTTGQRVDLHLNKAAEIWPTMVDAAQLENAILNLCLNARDAMRSNGVLAIETRNVVVDAATLSATDVAAGQYVRITVSDSGAGIAPEDLKRIFEPFFSTKPKGKGTGLGLAMIHGFIRQSRGYIRVDSELGEGTVISMYLPRLNAGDHDSVADTPA